jgi:menaquinol-cytochrome c reductase iron-sulfur subunit
MPSGIRPANHKQVVSASGTCPLNGCRKLPKSRRGFLKIATGILSAVIGVILAIPFLAALIGPIYKKKKVPFVKAGQVASLSEGQPVNLRFQYQSKDAFIRQLVTHDVWVIKHSNTELTVFSPICTHLGCYYNWNAQAGQFICPCHGSHFSITGKVISGPAPRPLDTLPHKIENGAVYIKWERFEPGIPRKVRV